MLIESDDVYAIYDGPCNRTECEEASVSNCQLHKCYGSAMIPNFIYTYVQMQVCGTDIVTYPSICVLRSQSSNTRVDYEDYTLTAYKELYTYIYNHLT